jgi:hypothetical protein
MRRPTPLVATPSRPLVNLKSAAGESVPVDNSLAEILKVALMFL